MAGSLTHQATTKVYFSLQALLMPFNAKLEAEISSRLGRNKS
jgi:hypothetical protein